MSRPSSNLSRRFVEIVQHLPNVPTHRHRSIDHCSRERQTLSDIIDTRSCLRFHRILRKFSPRSLSQWVYKPRAQTTTKPTSRLKIHCYLHRFPCGGQTRPSRCVDTLSLSLSLQNRTRSRPRLDTYTPIKRIPVYYGAHFANLMAGVPTGHTRGDKGKREVVTSRGRDRLTVRTSF